MADALVAGNGDLGGVMFESADFELGHWLDA
jgi:hypothetical protein